MSYIINILISNNTISSYNRNKHNNKCTIRLSSSKSNSFTVNVCTKNVDKSY